MLQMAQRLLLQRSLSRSARYYSRTSLSSTVQIPTHRCSSYSFLSLKTQLRYIHVSHPVLSDKEEQEKDDSVVPFFQNPLHHDDPKYEKVMLSDYENGEEPELVPLPPLDDGSGKVVAAPHLHDLADEVVNLTMLEMKELVDRVADHFGIEETADDDIGVASVAVEEEVVEEKTVFDLKMTAFDDKSKIKVIKEIRAITGLGLKEAKEMVEGVPKVIRKDIKKEEAEELKVKLEAVGATIEIV
jgi:large subunit ribosomal protein L7/L12